MPASHAHAAPGAPYTPTAHPSAAGPADALPDAWPPFPTYWPHKRPWHPRQRRLCNALRSRLALLYAVPPTDARQRRTAALLLAAKRALDDGQVEAGWAILHETDVLDLRDADAATLRRTASRLRAECAAKLRSWRRVRALAECDAALAIVAPADGGRVADEALPDAREAVAHAMRLRDEHFANVYGGVGTAHNKVVFLSLVVLAVLGGLLTLAYRRPDAVTWLQDSKLRGAAPYAAFHAMLQAMALGVLGAVFSAALERTRAAGRPLPEQLGDWSTIFVRPLLGATAAVIVLAVAAADTVGVKVDSAGALVVLCFAAGFSERFVVRFVRPDADAAPPTRRRAAPPDDDGARDDARHDAGDGAHRAGGRR